MFWNRLLALGPGVGIEIRGEDLVVALVKSRWKGVVVAGRTRLKDFRRRPAAEWGADYSKFLKSHGFRDVPATLALPRAEVIVRSLSLPATTRSDLRSAVRLQIDSLHPYGEDNVYYSFSALERRGALATAGGAAPGQTEVAVVIAAKAAVDGYADLLAEAGVKLRAMTVAAAAFYGATRLMRRGEPDPFLLLDEQGSTYELYGESPARRFFSAAFATAVTPIERAVAAGAAELRLSEGDVMPVVACGERTAASSLPAEQVLGSPLEAPEEFDLARDATAFATALAGACPRWGWRTNLLPSARRSSSSRWPLAATAVTAVAVGAVALLLGLRGPLQDRRYEQSLERDIKRLEAVEREVHVLEQQTQKARARRAQLESFRRRPETDLYMLTEISRRLPASAWVNHLQINDDGVQLTGQADTAAPLLSLLDSSGVVTGASFMSSISRADNREQFRIHASRRATPAGSEQASAATPPAAAGHGTDAPAAPGHNQAPATLPPGHSQGAPPPAGAHSPAHSSN